MKRLIFMVFLLLTAAILVAQDLTIEEIISKNLATIGQERVMSFGTIRRDGIVNIEGMEFPIFAIEKYPKLNYSEIEMQGLKIIIAGDGETGWTINPITGSSEPQDLPEFMINNLERESVKDPTAKWHNSFVNWKEKGFKAELIGMEQFDNRPVYNLQFTFEDDYVVNYFMDASEFVVLKVRSTETEQGQTFKSEIIYRDYKDVDGVLIPYRIEMLVNGQVTQIFIINNVEFDVAVDDSIFAKPGMN